MNSIAAPRAGSRPTVSIRSLLYLAWAIVLLLTVPEIILRAFMRVDTSWMLLARIGLLAGALALTVVWPLVRPLRGMLLAGKSEEQGEHRRFGIRRLPGDDSRRSQHPGRDDDRLERVASPTVRNPTEKRAP